MKKIVYFICLIIFACSCENKKKQQNTNELRTQNYIEGHVKETNGEPVAGILVGAWIDERIYGGSRTDENGRYRVNLPVNEENIQLRYCLTPKALTDLKILKDTSITKKEWDKQGGTIMLRDVHIRLQDFANEGVLIRGKLLNTADGSPLSGVRFFCNKKEIVTNKSGDYVFLVRDSIIEKLTLHFSSGSKSWQYDTTIIASQGSVVYLPDLKMTKTQAPPESSAEKHCTLEGKTVNKKGKSIDKVLVSLRNASFGTNSRRNGTFKFLMGNIGADGLSDTLIFRKEGFHDRYIPVKLMAGKKIHLDTIILREKTD